MLSVVQDLSVLFVRLTTISTLDLAYSVLIQTVRHAHLLLALNALQVFT